MPPQRHALPAQHRRRADAVGLQVHRKFIHGSADPMQAPLGVIGAAVWLYRDPNKIGQFWPDSLAPETRRAALAGTAGGLLRHLRKDGPRWCAAGRTASGCRQGFGLPGYSMSMQITRR